MTVLTRSFSAAFAFLSIGLSAFGAQRGEALPTLITTHAAHSLTFQEAKRGYPIRFRAVVTYYDPYTNPKLGAFFACERTGCICVLVPPKPVLPIRPGNLVDVTGVSDPGHFAPVVDASGVEVVGQSPLPPTGPRRSLAQLMTGADDSRWIEVEGVVHSVKQSGRNVTLAVALKDGTIQGITALEAGVDYTRLIYSTVVIHGNAAPLFSKNRQMVGARLPFPSMNQLRIEEPAAADAFSKPISSLNNLLQFTPDFSFRHRVRVHGRVTLQWASQWLVIQEGAQGLFVPVLERTLLQPGDEADVVGFPAMGEYAPTLEGAVFKRTGVAHRWMRCLLHRKMR